MFLLLSSNPWLVKLFAPDRDAGLYAACFMMAQAAAAPGRVLTNRAFVPLASAFAAGRTAEAAALVRQAVGIMVAVAAPVCIIALTHGERLLAWLYGPRYAGTGPRLGLLCVATCGMSLTSFLSAAMGAAGRQRARLAVAMALVAVATAGALAMMPVFGAVGAAGGLASSGAIVMARLVRHSVGPFIPWTILLAAAAATASIGAVGPWIGHLPVFAGLTAGGLLYALLFVTLGTAVRRRTGCRAKCRGQRSPTTAMERIDATR